MLPRSRKTLRSLRGASRKRSASRYVRRRWNSMVARPQVMYNLSLPKAHNSFPPRYVTSLQTGFGGTLTTQNNYTFNFLGNGIDLPFSTASLPGSALGFLSAGYGLPTPNTTSLNSMQPVNKSILALSYSTYRVRASSVKLSVQSYVYPAIVTVLPTHNLYTTASTELAQSAPYSKTKLVTQYSGSKDNTIYSKMDTKTIWGATETQFIAAVDFAAPTSGNPQNAWYWNINIKNTLDNSSAMPVYVLLEVNYEVEFWGPQNGDVNT